MTANQQPSSPEDFWQSMLDLDLPDEKQLAAEEAELAALEASEPVDALPQEVIDRIVARAVRPVDEDVDVVVPMRSVWGVQRWLLAALLLVSVASVAWWQGLLWQEQKFATESLDFAMAVELVGLPGRNDQAYLSAMGRIVDNCEYGAFVLNAVRAQTAEPALATAANQLAGDLVRLLTGGPRPGPSAVDEDIVAVGQQVLDASLSLADRQQALTHLGNMLSTGVQAMLMAPLTAQLSVATRSQWVSGLLTQFGG